MKTSAEEEALTSVSAPILETQNFNSGVGILAPSAESKQSENVAASEELSRIAREAIKKEDEDFEKMEALFIESLNLGSTDLLKRWRYFHSLTAFSWYTFFLYYFLKLFGHLVVMFFFYLEASTWSPQTLLGVGNRRDLCDLRGL